MLLRETSGSEIKEDIRILKREISLITNGNTQVWLGGSNAPTLSSPFAFLYTCKWWHSCISDSDSWIVVVPWFPSGESSNPHFSPSTNVYSTFTTWFLNYDHLLFFLIKYVLSEKPLCVFVNITHKPQNNIIVRQYQGDLNIVQACSKFHPCKTVCLQPKPKLIF